jgi:CobQ-like glutamine amidotransferase family enzyme
MTERIVIAHMYPRDMNIYGDLGNVITLVKRLEWRGYQAKVLPVEVGMDFDFDKADIVFGGGGQDSGQIAVGDDLLERGGDLRRLASEGMPMLVICGLYQLFGHAFITHDGREIKGIDVIDATTRASHTRLIGNVAVDSPRFGRLVGFENHSGQTELAPGQEALGKILKGEGNKLGGGYEGAIAGNVVGTYLHGPVLPKNPKLADFLIARAIERRFGKVDLKPLNDALERQASDIAFGRPR